MAEAVKNAFPVEVELIKSGGGAFEVKADGELIFSKKEQHRFPEHSEIIEALKAR